MPSKATQKSRSASGAGSSAGASNAPAAGSTSAQASSSSAANTSAAAASTSASASTSSAAKPPPKKKARTASGKQTKKATTSTTPAARKATGAASSSSTSASTSSNALVQSTLSGSLSLTTPRSRIAGIAERAAEACYNLDDALEAARFLDTKLRTHTAQGCPEMILTHIQGARPHTSFRKRTRASAAAIAAGEGDGDEYDEFADSYLQPDHEDDDEDDDMDDDDDEDDEQGGAAALLMLGQTPQEKPQKDEYGRRAVKAENIVDLILARRDWLKERKRLLEKALAFWQRVIMLDKTGKRLDAPVKCAQHTLDLVGNYSLPQEGLALLLKAHNGLLAAMPKAKSGLPSAAHHNWDNLTKAMKIYAGSYVAGQNFLTLLTPAHFDLLRTFADTGYHLAVMRGHYQEHLKDSIDKVMRPSVSYSYHLSTTAEEEVKPPSMLAAASAFRCFLIDQMAYALGADLHSRHSRKVTSKDGSGQKALPVSTTAEESSSHKVTITPAMIMKGLAALHEPQLSDFKSATARDNYYDLSYRTTHLTSHHKLPMMMGAEYQSYAHAERTLRHAKLMERVQTQEAEVRKMWGEMDSIEMRGWSLHRDTIDDSASMMISTRKRLRDALAASKASQGRMLAEARALLMDGLTRDVLLRDAVAAGAPRAVAGAGAAAGLGTVNGVGGIAGNRGPLAVVPQVVNLISDVRGQIFDLDGRVTALMDMARCMTKLLRWRFQELSKIGKPTVDAAGLASSSSDSTSAQNRVTAMSTTLGAPLRKGFSATDEQLLDSAQRFWTVAHITLDLLHAALDRLTGPEYVDLDEVSDIERVLIQAERGTREWSDRVALTTDVARLRLRLANWIAEIRLVMANEILAPYLAQLDWDTDKLEDWRPRGAVLDADSARKWARWKRSTAEEAVTSLRTEGDDEDIQFAGVGRNSNPSELSEDERKALSYLRHIYLIHLAVASSKSALRLAGFDWINKLRTKAPFSRVRADACLDALSEEAENAGTTRDEALRELKWDIKLAHCRDDWQTSARRAEALIGAMRAGFAYWRAAVENSARISATGGIEGVPSAFTALDMASIGSAENARGRDTGAAVTSTSTSLQPDVVQVTSPAMALPAHSFLPKEANMPMRSAYRTVDLVYPTQEDRRQQIGGYVLAFRTLVDTVGLEKLTNSRSGSGSATLTASSRSGSGPSSMRGVVSPAGQRGSTQQAQKKKNEGKGKEKAADRGGGKEADIKLTRIPRASKAWKMHLIAFHECRDLESKYLLGTSTTPEPYMNEIRKMLSLKVQSSSTAAQSTLEGPFGAPPSGVAAALAASGPTYNRNMPVKKSLVIRSEAEERYGELAIVYRERCFWIEVVRATMAGSSVFLA